MPSIVLVRSQFHDFITSNLLRGALEELKHLGYHEDDIKVLEVAGCFEIPWACQYAIRTYHPKGIVTIGVLIKGETEHHDYIARAVFHHLIEISTSTGVPITLAILTTDSTIQALERAGGKKGHKGKEAVRALHQLLNLS